MLGRLRNTVNRARDRVGLRPLIWGVILTLVALTLDFVPLYDLLGYDFAFALGIVVALAGVDIGHGVIARARAKAGAAPAGVDLARAFGRAAALTAGTLALPLLLGIANAARVKNCSLPEGLAFFALLPVMSALYAATAGVLAGLAAPSPRRGRVLAFALPLASIVWTLLRLYRDPPVFAFDPFGGYFPGPIYDEALRPPLALLLFRIANLVWIRRVHAGPGGRRARPRSARGRRAPGLAAIPLVVASVALYALGGRLGFHIGRADLARELNRTATTDHFVVRYAAGSKTRTDLALEIEDLEFRYDQLRQTLGVEPTPPITVWDFPSPEVKKALVGAEHTLYAKPWTREIFVQGERFPSTRLRHELAHVFAGTFGDPILGVALAWRWGPLPHPALAMGLVEGLAEAADSDAPAGDATIHQEAAAMMAAGLAPPLGDVVGAGFSTVAGARAYTMAGSFAAFLLATRGADKLRALYRSAGNFTNIYRVPLRDLDASGGSSWPSSRSPRVSAPRPPKRSAGRPSSSGSARASWGRASPRPGPRRRPIRRAPWSCCARPAPTIPRSRSTSWRWRGPRWPPGGEGGPRSAAGAAGAGRRADRPAAGRGGVAVGGHRLLRARLHENAEAHQRAALDLAAAERADRRLAYAKLRGLASPTARRTLGRALFGDDPTDLDDNRVLPFYLFTEYARLTPAMAWGRLFVGRQLLSRDPAHALPALAHACGDGGTGATAGQGALPPVRARVPSA